MSSICLNCIGDKELHRLISSEIHEDKCTYCRKIAPCIELEYLAEVVDVYLRKYCRRGNEIPVFEPGQYKPIYEEEGEPLMHLLQEELEIDADPAQDLSKILIEKYIPDINHGEDYFYGDEYNYERNPISPFQYEERWNTFCDIIKHKSRFFDKDVKSLLEEILGNHDKSDSKQLPLLEFGPDTSNEFIFRARRIDSKIEAKKIMNNPIIELGPPPPNKALANRMNPAGISVFYGSLSEKTAVSEVRPFIGGLVIVGKFKAIRKLKILDLSQIGKGFTGSIFHPEYETRAAHLEFFKIFHSLITKPIQPNDEIFEYIPTQVFAEYISNILNFDGILYRSAQLGNEPYNIISNRDLDEKKIENFNIVLFQKSSIIELEERVNASLSFVEGSLKVVKIGIIACDYYETSINSADNQIEF